MGEAQWDCVTTLIAFANADIGGEAVWDVEGGNRPGYGLGWC